MAGRKRRWLFIWYLLLAAMLAQLVLYGIAAGMAAYCRQAASRDFIAAAAIRQDVDQVPFSGVINTAARRSGVSSRLVAAIILTESSFEPRALSPAGAAGLMQVIPGTWRQVNSETKICTGRHSGECTLGCFFDPELNIGIGTAYLAQLLRRYDGDATRAVAAYNAGPGAVDRCGGIPPFSETQGYVIRVMANFYQLGHSPGPSQGLAEERWDQVTRIAGWSITGTLLGLILLTRHLYKIQRSWRWR